MPVMSWISGARIGQRRSPPAPWRKGDLFRLELRAGQGRLDARREEQGVFCGAQRVQAGTPKPSLGTAHSRLMPFVLWRQAVAYAFVPDCTWESARPCILLFVERCRRFGYPLPRLAYVVRLAPIDPGILGVLLAVRNSHSQSGLVSAFA